MKYNVLLILTAISMTGCSSPDYADSMLNPDTKVVGTRIDISQELNATYCEMQGFKKFYESERDYTFECKGDGSKFRVPK